MSSIDNDRALLDALRRVGVVIPDVDRQVLAVVEHKYWHVYCGAFDTMVDYRDAHDPDNALLVACEPLQPWYVRKVSFAETPKVEQATRNEYIEWLKRGVR